MRMDLVQEQGSSGPEHACEEEKAMRVGPSLEKGLLIREKRLAD